MKAALHGYQQRAVHFILERPAAALFMEMGLGKTLVTLTALAELFDRCEIDRVLVIAPKRVAESTWPAEITKWNHTRHLGYALAVGDARARRAAVLAGKPITIINRENVPWLVEAFGKRWPFDAVVIDESSSFKDPSTARFKALRRVRGQIDRMVLLTGTPAPNSLLELWPQMWLLDRGEALGRTFTGFREAFFVSDYMGYRWTPRPGAEAEIYRRIEPLALTLRQEDWLELPERVDNVIRVELPARAQQQYREFEREYLLPVASGERISAANAAVLAGKLLQLANGAAYVDEGEGAFEEIHAAKLDALEELAEDGAPVLVAFQFRSDLARLRRRFPRARPLLGPRDIEDWNAGRVPMLLAHPASAGHGLNLQAGGSRIVWFGLTWSLEQYQQFNARLHRQGQRRGVIVHHLVAGGTVDEDVIRALQAKEAGQNALLDALRLRAEALKERRAA